MAKRLLPTPETFEALANLVGLESLSSVRTIKINFVGGEPVTVDVEMFVWDHDVLTSVIEQLAIDDERTTNVKIEVPPHLAERADRINVQSVTDSDPVYVDGLPAKP